MITEIDNLVSIYHWLGTHWLRNAAKHWLRGQLQVVSTKMFVNQPVDIPNSKGHTAQRAQKLPRFDSRNGTQIAVSSRIEVVVATALGCSECFVEAFKIVWT